MHITFDKLPPDIQGVVLSYLEANDFQTAKQVRDEYEMKILNAEDKDLRENRYREIKMNLSLFPSNRFTEGN